MLCQAKVAGSLRLLDSEINLVFMFCKFHFLADIPGVRGREVKIR